MLKKVLSVVLALVLALGVCAVASSAATAKTLQEFLDKLPSEYNAHFYNDETEALILEARAAAEDAIKSGDAAAINSAYALCQDAFDTANDGEEIWCDAVDDYVWVYTNRDESKGVADFNYTSTAGEYLKPGDTFTITVSLKTNFVIQNMQTGFVYDHNVFEYVEDSAVYPDENLATLDYELTRIVPDWGHRPTGGIKWDGVPSTWTEDDVEQYYLFERPITYNTKSEDFFNPENETVLYTVTMKVRDDATVGSTGRIYINDDFCATHDNYYLGEYNYPLVQLHRAYGYKIDELVADMYDPAWEGNQIKPAWKVTDETARSGHTINFLGDSDFTVTIGEAPSTVDYTALEDAIAAAEALNEEDYTEATWADLAKAVEAGKEGLTADDQATVDTLAADINAKIQALAPFEQDSEIISVTAKTTPVVGVFTTLEVLVSKPANKIQFVNAAGSTATYYPGNDRVISVVDNADGTQTWTIKMMVYQTSETYKVFPKFSSVWDSKYYRFILKDTHEYDGKIYSVSVPDAKDSRVKLGRHDVIVEAGLDVRKVQFSYLGTTATFTTDNASYEEVDGRNVWTVNFNFCKAEDGFTADLLARTPVGGFEKTDVTLVVDVLH